MKIKINDKVICFPPFISTSWENVRFLRVENEAITGAEILVITLADGSHIKIPNLEEKFIYAIFASHLKFLEQRSEAFSHEKETSFAKKIPAPETMNENALGGFGFPLRFGIAGIEGLGAALQHNPGQADTPLLPSEILNKIAAIAKVVGNDDIAAMPQPEKNCNCVHCQIARAIHQGAGPENHEIDPDEIVTDEDLKFRLWDISHDGNNLYTVTNPTDTCEYYNVYLGDPVGCTCGQKNCEHIKAVLNS